MKNDDYVDPDDMFSDTRMTFGEHIEDLRTHLLRAIKGFVLCMALSFLIAKPILHFITAPVDAELQAFDLRYSETRRKDLEAKIARNEMAMPLVELKVKVKRAQPAPPPETKENAVLPKLVPYLISWLEGLGMDIADPRLAGAGEWEDLIMRFPDPLALDKELKQLQALTKPRSLTSLSIQEPFVVFFKVSIMAGFVFSSPWVFYQIWSFVAAGLYPHEKRLVNVYLPVSLFLFLAGAFICEFFVIPKAVAALLWFNELLDIQPDLRLNEWLGFAIFMPLVFGLSFQTPLVMLFLYMVGVFDIDSYKEKRRMAIFLMAIFAAFITPSTDAVSMMFMFVPMCLLYEIGIWLCYFKRREEQETLEEDDTHELVEV
jgi:sec-independent protein translocase protein TatC